MHETAVSRLDESTVPRFGTSVPATIYLNGKQEPPIEANGEITCMSLNSLQLRCDQKIPIPSNGKIRFGFGSPQQNLEMNVDFIQRIELVKSFWSWKMQPRYELRVAFNENKKKTMDLYQDEIHRLIFGNRTFYYNATA